MLACRLSQTEQSFHGAEIVTGQECSQMGNTPASDKQSIVKIEAIIGEFAISRVRAGPPRSGS